MPKRHYRPRRAPRPIEVSLLDDPEERAIARLDRLTEAGRSLWFSLLFYLTFATITALGVRDADFFIGGAATQLPLIGVSIPTPSFFLFAPILGAALYIYLHLLIRKTSEAAAHAPPRVRATPEMPNGIPIERAIKPWLVIDLALRLRNAQAIDERPLDRLADFTTITLVWLAGPYVLGLLWQNTFTLHNLGLTSLAGICFFASIWVGAESWAKLEDDTAPTGRAVLTTKRQRNRRLIPLYLLVFATGLIGTKGLYIPVDQTYLPDWLRGRPLAARPDLRDAQLSALPPELADPTVARAEYRADWCKRLGIEPNVCGNLPSAIVEAPPYQVDDRKAWCETKPALKNVGCAEYFAVLDEEFSREWNGYRTALIAALNKPDMRGRDLRNADFTRASLTGLEFEGAQMEGADLSWAQMERADLSGAQMQGADLSYAQMQRAFLSRAQMQRAFLSGAQMQGADLRRAEMERADLSFAQMQGADLREAMMEGADLRGAQMERADLSYAQMQRADLREAQMQGVDLSLSILTGKPESVTNLINTNLSASTNSGGALRFLNMSDAVFDARTDFRNAFVDRSVLLPKGFPEPIVRACGWITEIITDDAEFYGKWRGWLETVQFSSHNWQWLAPSDWSRTIWRDLPVIPPPPECQWDTSPLPGADAP